MRRIPGIVFADGPTGRRARIAGTGIDVFEIVGTYRSLGVDVSSSHERGRNGLSDDDQLLLAAEEGHCLVTGNRGDFIALTVQRFETGEPHAGALIITRRLTQAGPEAIARALLDDMLAHPADLPPHTIDYLHA